MRHLFPPVTIAGLTVALVTVLVGVLGSDLASATAFLGVFLFGTGIWHGIRGRSWLAPLLPQGRRVGAASMALGLVVMVMAGAATPATGTDAPIPATSASPSPSPSRSPASPTPSSAPPAPIEVPSATATPDAGDPTSQEPAATTSPGPGEVDALAALGTVEIKGRAPKTGYSREEFGQRWADTDRNGCDTRNDILRRDLTDVQTKPDTRDCVILTGVLLDPYTATTIEFTRGQDTSSEVQIDHVVALSDAWQKGAQQLDTATRTLFANDPLNLLAVQGRANQQKGDGDAATWLPSNKQFRCQYVARQVAVKATYALWVTQAEHDAIARVLSTCPGEPLPTGTAAPLTDSGTVPAETAPVSAEPSAEAAPADPAPAPTEAVVPGETVYYKNCAAAREAGAAPILRGEPGYRSGLDGDDDGIACE